MSACAAPSRPSPCAVDPHAVAAGRVRQLKLDRRLAVRAGAECCVPVQGRGPTRLGGVRRGMHRSGQRRLLRPGCRRPAGLALRPAQAAQDTRRTRRATSLPSAFCTAIASSVPTVAQQAAAAMAAIHRWTPAAIRITASMATSSIRPSPPKKPTAVNVSITAARVVRCAAAAVSWLAWISFMLSNESGGRSSPRADAGRGGCVARSKSSATAAGTPSLVRSESRKSASVGADPCKSSRSSTSVGSAGGSSASSQSALLKAATVSVASAGRPFSSVIISRMAASSAGSISLF